MAPLRSTRYTRTTRTQSGPLSLLPGTSNHPTPIPQPAPVAERLTEVDGIAHGWHYKHLYSQPEPEFPRQPHLDIPRPTDPRAPCLALRDLECLREGEYGKVLLIRTKRTSHVSDQGGCLFAMKALRKKLLRAEDARNPNKKNTERSILVDCSWSPFVSTVIQTFYDPRNLYILLEFAPCGTLRSLISSQAPLPLPNVLFYLSNIICALSFLESRDIVHRDLKPDNILITESGYLVLVDFGTSAVEGIEKDWVMVGTPCYMAPELLSPEGQSHGYGTAVDWWATGCILFEMITRRMAFRGKDERVTYQKILAVEYEYPPGIRVGKCLKSLVSALLTRDSGKRLGTQGGSPEVSTHPWLTTVDWGKMKSRQYLAPYVPHRQNLTKQWHSNALPFPKQVPGLPVVVPPIEMAHDLRFPERKVV